MQLAILTRTNWKPSKSPSKVIKLNPRNCKGKTRNEKKRRGENLEKWHQENGLFKVLDPSSEGFEEVYKLRNSSENANNTLKENLPLDKLRFRGLEKAGVHALLCCTCMLTVALMINEGDRT